MAKIKIKTKKPWIAYPGSTIQQNYAEHQTHGFLLWDIKDSKTFDVQFKELVNPVPFLTIDWKGSVAATCDSLKKYENGVRIRVKSAVHISQQEMQNLINELKKSFNAIEVTFKIDAEINRNSISVGNNVVNIDNIRSVDVISRLLLEFYASMNLSAEEQLKLQEQLKSYYSKCFYGIDASKNSKWSLRKIEFDNMFAYGEKNVVNFEKLNGIVGIFGQNRIGKSSFVGTIMYSLFNTTDRGPIKNLHVCNVRKPYCYSRAIVNIDAIDYVIERQTVKNETKRGQVNAATNLNFSRISNGNVIDLVGEQRNDTEKQIKNLIGSSEDFLLTSLAAQGEINQYIALGSTKRRQLLSKFLDLDVFDKLYEAINKDLATYKAQLKITAERDWRSIKVDIQNRISKLELEAVEFQEELSKTQHDLDVAKASLATHGNITPVTLDQISSHKDVVARLKQQIKLCEDNKKLLEHKRLQNSEKINLIADLRKEHDVKFLSEQVQKLQETINSSLQIKGDLDKQNVQLNAQVRSLKILDEVPCGDAFPTCKFIKDAHENKAKIAKQQQLVQKLNEDLVEVQQQVAELKQQDFDSKLRKITKLTETQTTLTVENSKIDIELQQLNSKLEKLLSDEIAAAQKLNNLQKSYENLENSEVFELKSNIELLQKQLKQLDMKRMTNASLSGKLHLELEKLRSEEDTRSNLLSEMKTVELLANAMSKKGIPNNVVSTQLPLINAEIAKILNGIVDFTVELEIDAETEAMDVYINYGDSKRIIELASGMEKMVSSMAIRVALINISTLPKTDMFIIDEGFGALDDMSVEACNRLLHSLKRYFRTIIVITHVDGIKDAADYVLEVSKFEKDAKLCYE